MTKVTVILGAGASSDVWNRMGNVDWAWRPPLTRELFGPFSSSRDARDAVYEPILDNYRGAQVIQMEVGPRLRDDKEVSIETELERYARSKDSPIRRRQFLDVPPYFRHLFIEIAARHTQRLGNYNNLIGALYDTQHEVAFVVLNYDALLEQALATFHRRFSISDMDSYLPDANGRPLIVKLHGSVDWGVDIGEAMGNEDSWARRMDGFKIEGVDPEEAMFQPGKSTVWQWRGPRNQALYPVLTAPLAGKGLVDAVCRKSHLEALGEFIADCRKFLVIGTSGRDLDLLSILDANSAEAETVQFVCGTLKASEDTARRFRESIGAWERAELMAVDMGLGKYVLPEQSIFPNFLARRN